MPIRILPAHVASQIAAGEVAERPASVVKELVENALDGGATQVIVRVEGAGKRLISVSDDGVGIAIEELPLAVARHATSKITSAEDLHRIMTLGFRGEALAAIGSVSRLTITSRLADAESGGQLRVEAGNAGRVETVGAPVGTLVQVEDLFFNLPARLKFLKKDVTERRQIDELVTRYALAYPHVRFKLAQDGNVSLQTSGSGDQREVLAAVFGVETARQMLTVLAEYEDLKISGYISPLTLTRSNRREITFFINGRWVQDAGLTSALVQAYHTMLMVGRYPLAAVFLEVPPELVDVNVHPAKAEVRFRDRDQVFSGVQRAVRRALLAYTPVASLEIEYPRKPAQFSLSGRSDPSAVEIKPWQAESEEAKDSQILSPGSTFTRTHIPILRLIGQIAGTYLVAEGPDGLYLVDQHAAHERVLYEKFLAQRSSAIPWQNLLSPVAVEFTPAAARLLENQLDLLKDLGFAVDSFGANTFLVRSMPAIFSSLDPAAALRTLVEDFEEDETPFGSEIEARIIARICKRAAVKAGQTLSPQEQKALLNELESCRSPRTCPHGRPTMIHLSVDLLERQFGRRGAR